MDTVSEKSFWLEQLTPRAPYVSLDKNLHADVVVVGGGIAGCMTARELLRTTSRDVVLVEGGKIAHGATGHNAGQCTTYFEKTIPVMVAEYGEEQTAAAQRAMIQALEHAQECVSWIDNMHHIHTSLLMTQEYAGIMSDDDVRNSLETVRWFQKRNIEVEGLLISHEWIATHDIPDRFTPCYQAVSSSHIQDILAVSSHQYHAVEVRSVALANSAHLCDSLVTSMLLSYPSRFHVYEHTMIATCDVDMLKLHTSSGYMIHAHDVILCTNGFTHMRLVDSEQSVVLPDIHGIVGYMNGYRINDTLPAHAFTYPDASLQASSYDTQPYWYLTTRPDTDGGSLVCVGGEETRLDAMSHYDASMRCPSSVVQKTQHIIQEECTLTHNVSVQKHYQRHGLMGYTPSGMRLIGGHPGYDHIWYNVGCNGVGILPSIHGAMKIASLLSGVTYQPSVFDVRIS